MKMNRKVQQTRKLYKKVLILCEGLTEKNYLVSAKNSLPRELQKGVKIEIDNYKKTDPRSLILEAIKRKKLQNLRVLLIIIFGLFLIMTTYHINILLSNRLRRIKLKLPTIVCVLNYGLLFIWKTHKESLQMVTKQNNI